MLFKTFYSLCTKEHRCLGIDIGTSSIKAVVLSKLATSIQLDFVAVVELPEGTLKNKQIIQPELFENALKLIRADIPRTIKNTTIAITGSNVISKVVQVDHSLSEAEIEYYLYGNLSLLTSKVAEAVNIDFAVIGENKIDESLKDVFVVVAKKSLIDVRVLSLKKSGFNCSIVDLESHALMRSLQLQFNLTPKLSLNRVVANLHIGETTTLIMIVSSGELAFSRELNIGVAHLVEHSNGHTSKYRNKTLNLDVAQKLAAQLKHCLQNYSSIFGGKHIDSWFSSGGGSHLSALITFLENVLAATINTCQPFNRLDCLDKKVAQQKQVLMPIQGCFQVALGLAVRGLI
jgi:type IV pilus assembly protein PilM